VFCPFGYAAKKLPLQINRWSEFLTFDTSLENRSPPPIISLADTFSDGVEQNMLEHLQADSNLTWGTITASSQPDEKTTFNVVLPA